MFPEGFERCLRAEGLPAIVSCAKKIEVREVEKNPGLLTVDPGFETSVCQKTIL